ncbi:Acyl-CoA dehydrogenase apdG like protein [Verticillium longisporum]|nr:Acyl-CoA dehydrogenase apdG like protein [Verticillium longisporum]
MGRIIEGFNRGVKFDAILGGAEEVLGDLGHGEGVEAKQIKTSYSTTAGTAYITYDDVKVPVENLLGAENNGIHVVLSNFNHERWTMTSATVRNCRLAEAC